MIKPYTIAVTSIATLNLEISEDGKEVSVIGIQCPGIMSSGTLIGAQVGGEPEAIREYQEKLKTTILGIFLEFLHENQQEQMKKDGTSYTIQPKKGVLVQ